MQSIKINFFKFPEMIKKYIKHLPKILNPVLFLLYLFVYFFPRDKKNWVFGSGVGSSFSDNAKYFFLYCSQQYQINSYWISTNRPLVEKLKEEGLHAYYKYSFKGIWLCVRSKVFVYDSRVNGINYWLSNGAFKVALWHGSPLKTIDKDVSILTNMFYIGNHTFGLKRYFIRFLNPECFVTPDFMIATSDKIKGYFYSAFGAKQIEVTGYPRNDIISNPKLYDYYLGFEQQIIDSITTKKIILYTPTFRDTKRYNRKTPIEWEQLNNLLKNNSATFLIKLHRNDYSIVMKEEFSNIRVLASNIDIYPLFSKVDLLITDYSSIFFDFLLTNKPVLFFPYDKNSYLTQDRSLYDDYDKVTPGKKAYTFKELYDNLNNFLLDSSLENDVVKYPKIKDEYNKFSDDQASKRVFEKLLSITIEI